MPIAIQSLLSQFDVKTLSISPIHISNRLLTGRPYSCCDLYHALVDRTMLDTSRCKQTSPSRLRVLFGGTKGCAAIGRIPLLARGSSGVLDYQRCG